MKNQPTYPCEMACCHEDTIVARDCVGHLGFSDKEEAIFRGALKILMLAVIEAETRAAALIAILTLLIMSIGLVGEMVLKSRSAGPVRPP